MNTQTQKTAFQVTASIEGKSWELKRTTLTAPTAEEARTKAITVLNLKPEHKIEVEAVTVFSTSEILKSEVYPYGNLKTTATYKIEFNKKGFRSIFQTVNPKTGRINNPKAGTYYIAILPMYDSAGKFDSCGHLQFNGSEDINTGLHFMNDFFELFTEQQIESIAIHLVAMMKVNAKAQIMYCGTDWEQLKPLMDSQIRAAVEIVKTKDNKFLDCLFDVAKIEALKKPNYNPFKVTEQITI